MIEVQKETTKYPDINLPMLVKGIEITLVSFSKPDVDLTLRITDDLEMRQLNQHYRGINKPTDVLAFNQDFINPETNSFYLGDIIISVDRALEQAPENAHSLVEECTFLAIHGTLHLLGCDHDELEQKVEMWRLQEDIFRKTIAEFQENLK